MNNRYYVIWTTDFSCFIIIVVVVCKGVELHCIILTGFSLFGYLLSERVNKGSHCDAVQQNAVVRF